MSAKGQKRTQPNTNGSMIALYASVTASVAVTTASLTDYIFGYRPPTGFVHTAICPPKEKPRDIAGCVKTKWAPVIRGLFFVSGGCGLNVGGAEHVVSEDGKGHLSFGSLEVSGQEPSACHHSLDAAERMLGSASSSRHDFGNGSCIHPSECILV